MSLNNFLIRLICLCVLPLVLFAVFLAYRHVHTLQAQQKREAEHRVRNVATALDHDLASRIAALQTLAASPLANDKQRLNEFYTEAESFHDNFGGGVILADLSMQMLLNTRVPFGTSLPKLPKPKGKGRAAVSAVLASGKPAIGDMLWGPVAKESLIAVAAPVILNGRINLILLNTFETRRFQQRINEVALPDSWCMTLLDGNNQVMARRAPPEIINRPVDMKSPGIFVAKLTSAPWSVVLEIPPEAHWKSIISATTALTVLILAVTLVSILGGRMASQRLTRAMATLTTTPSSVNISPLILEIEAVRAMLKAAAADKNESDELFRHVFEAANVAKSITTPEGRIFVNQAFYDLLGYDRHELKTMTWQELTPSEDVEPTMYQLASLLNGEKNATRFIKRYLHKNGSIVWADVSTMLRRDPSGKPLHFITTLVDITERIQAEEDIRKLNAELEERVRDRTAQLESLNKELEAFSYSVSHDLKAPLRGIDGYSQLLEKEFGSQLDDEGRLFIRNIRHGAAQMYELIEDMLAYSRMERRSLQNTLIDLAALVGAVVTDRMALIEQCDTQMRVDVPTIFVHTDRDGLAVALRNLLENAIKFSRNAQPPTIVISARTEGNRAILWVRDNGIGFDMKFHDRIFEIFQRLERSEDYPGTGIGLAMVRKAIRRMGGKVWAESAPGAGATFYLEVPL